MQVNLVNINYKKFVTKTSVTEKTLGKEPNLEGLDSFKILNLSE